MKMIFTISRWELTRLRTRFAGRSGFVAFAVILLALGSSYLVYQQGLVVSKGIYVVGVSFDGPVISDQRFQVVRLDQTQGRDMLGRGVLDVYLDGQQIVSRRDQRSQYATGALGKYLERQELLRIAAQYEVNRAFPLRVAVSYLEIPAGGLTIEREKQSPPASPPVETAPEPEPAGVPKSISLPEHQSSDAAVREQVDRLQGRGLSGLKESLLPESDVIIPSLMPPVMPLAQVTLSFLYVLPILFTSVFFASSLTEERVSRKLVILLSAPVSPFQVILGKMLPYLAGSLAFIVALSLMLGGNLWLSLAVFLPVALLIFSSYLMLALVYRTFKDQTFFSVLLLSAITAYLIVPAMLAGVSDLSYISPLTLAVEMYQGGTVTAGNYLLATTPSYLLFLEVIFISPRVFHEEYLASFKPLHTKAAEMLYWAIDKSHLNISAFFSSVFLIPLVFMAELAAVVLVSNLPMTAAIWILVLLSAGVEELAKSAGIIVLLKSRIIKTKTSVAGLSTLSALGFFSAEKLFLFLVLGALSRSALLEAAFGTGLLLLPLVLHVVSTGIVCLVTARLGTKYYPLALAIGTVIHAAYNFYVIRAF